MVESLENRLNTVLSDLRSIDDRELRFDLLIEYSDRFVEVPKIVAQRPFSASNKVPACESDAYAFAAKDQNNKIKVYFAVENPQGISAKALAVILSDIVDGSSANELDALDEQIVHDIFGKTISMGKGQGLMGMIRLTKELSRKL